VKLFRRAAFALLALALVAGGLWLFGRAPSADVLARECARYQAERRAEEAVLGRRIEALEDEGRARLEESYQRLLQGFKTIEIRGWRVVLVPPGVAPPPAEGYYVAGAADVSTPADPPALRGPMRVWYRPRGRLARLFDRLGWAGAPRLATTR